MDASRIFRHVHAPVFAVVLWAGGLAQAQTDWLSYRDLRLHYRVDYPDALFSEPEPMLEEGGIALQSADGSAKLFIFGGLNTSGETIDEFARGVAKLDDIYRVTYKRVTRSWFVLSGFLAGSGDIFYERVETSPDMHRLAGFRLEYPVTQRIKFDHLIGQIGRSLQVE